MPTAPHVDGADPVIVQNAESIAILVDSEAPNMNEHTARDLIATEGGGDHSASKKRKHKHKKHKHKHKKQRRSSADKDIDDIGQTSLAITGENETNRSNDTGKALRNAPDAVNQAECPNATRPAGVQLSLHDLL
jgi:hypothetical protein